MENKTSHTQKQEDKWHNDPKNWKLGIFYYNKQDKRIFPPKRNKYLGWTINFANPISIIVLVLLVMILVAISSFF